MTSALDTDDAAGPLRAELVDHLVDEGLLTDPAWRAAFAAVPRHVFVPFYYDHTGRRVGGDDPDAYGQWLSEVYTDRTLVTHRMDGAATSSSSEPSLMARMLDALQVDDSMKVLEIGTGTGYNAALLSHRLGSDHVTTIDVEPELTAAARERLADAGYQPVIDTGNGANGCPLYAPYDRIIATCGIDEVPSPWIRQLTGEGFILAPIRGALAKIRRTGPVSAEGRFLAGGAFFMPLRNQPTDGVPHRAPAFPEGPRRPSLLPLDMLADNDFRFLAAVVEPDLTWQYNFDDDRRIVSVGA